MACSAGSFAVERHWSWTFASLKLDFCTCWPQWFKESVCCRLVTVARLAEASVSGHRNQPFKPSRYFGTGKACFHAGSSLSKGIEPLKIIIDGTSPFPTPNLSTVSSTIHECSSEMRGTK